MPHQPPEAEGPDEDSRQSSPAWSRQTSSSSTDCPRHQCLTKKFRTRSNRTLTSEQREKTYRLLVLGASYVGKTAIISQLLYDQIPEDHTQTVQQMYLGKFGICGPPISVEIEDTSGSYFTDFPVMFELSLKCADGVILVFDASIQESFEEVKKLKVNIISKKKAIPIIVVANKMDLCNPPSNEEFATTVLNDWECRYVECSAKDNINISDVFKEVLGQVKLVQGEGVLSLGSISRHCFVRTMSSPVLPVFRNAYPDLSESDKLEKKQSCIAS